MSGIKNPRGRPHASSRELIEEQAISLFLRQGFAATTITAIAAACGVSKTSFFRYYSSKSDIVWLAFDAHIEHLRGLLDATDEALPLLSAVRQAVVEALASDTDDTGIWLRRFQLIDTSPELRGEESAHWITWSGVLSDFVAARMGCAPDDVTPAVVGGAVQALFLAKLRSWLPLSESPQTLMARLDADLRPLCVALQPWVDEARTAP